MQDKPDMPQRKIIHIDMDAFFASVEQRDNPELKGKPVVVGGSPVGRGGVVAAASYEARKFGIRSAMPSKTAERLCPNVIFIYPRFAVYKQVSAQIREIFSRYTDLVEPLSLDEAYLDVTEDKQHIGSAIAIAQQIRESIKAELNLTASAGISVNKFVAKVASGLQKPDGLTFIAPGEVERFMSDLKVEQFYGVGKVTAQKMNKMNILTGYDLKQFTEEFLYEHFGKAGKFYYNIVRGIDNRQVEPYRETKSVGAEDTFAADLELKEDLNEAVHKLAQIVFDRLKRNNLSGRTVTLKIKYHDFVTITRSKSHPAQVTSMEEIAAIATGLLVATDLNNKKIRLLGISISNFGNEYNKGAIGWQLKLFEH
ncbi:MAG: DNA polymerase IV [Taibaiella sp.]|nr:DNA polymerase IV [Taibaiella sp.]